ncbi:YceI family protein [Sphingomonas quercus]|uniref:YceI family protein n=1 Tax=Sphingomonas quercus TaxID=2842451 RepID=A0ABS6BHK4_9SPHN|nr:YceI family protein [Sphingomonas quercus]MBU3077795.1 YceI family protein [Sphingomonas quercus]
MTVRHLRYSSVAIALHWLIAALLLFEIGLGWRMDGPRGPETYAVYQLHKSIGITVLMLTLLRLAWRLTRRPPPFPPTLHPWERGLAHTVHVLFYVLLIGMPLTGWLLVSASRTAIPTVLYGLWPWPHVPAVATLDAVSKARVEGAAGFGHHALAWLAYALVALHVLGALKHQFVDRGGDMARMVPIFGRGTPDRGALASITISAIGIALALVAIGNRIHLKPIPLGAPPPAEAAVTRAPEPAPAAPAVTPAAAPPAAEPLAAPPPAAVAGPAAPVKWTVNRARSSLGFASHWSGGPIDGRFDRWDATISFHPDALAGSSVKVTIDMASAHTGVTDTESSLPEDDWFAVKAHPRATFTASDFRHLGGERYEARGTLDLRGVARPLVLPFTLAITGKTARMTGEVKIDRTSFGVGQGEWASTDDVPALVTVNVRITADAPQPITTARSK